MEVCTINEPLKINLSHQQVYTCAEGSRMCRSLLRSSPHTRYSNHMAEVEKTNFIPKDKINKQINKNICIIKRGGG